MIKKQCFICKKYFFTIPAKIKIGKGKFCSCKCYYIYKKGKPHKPFSQETINKIIKAQKGKPRPQTTGEKHGCWLGDKVGYHGIHKWLSSKYGKANKCENLGCKCINPKRYEWALIKGKKYERKRENFIMLCKSCHIKLDFTETGRKRLSQLAKLKTIKRNSKGRFISN